MSLKTPNTTTTSSTAKLLNKKLNVNLTPTPKYVENKIFINTKHVQNNPLGVSNQKNSMKKVIQSKLDIIKQQISRQINQHYKKQVLKQSRVKRNGSQLSSGVKNTSRSRVKSQKNTTFSASNSRIKKSHSKIFDNAASNYYHNKNDKVYDQQQTLKPTRLFDTFEPQSIQLQNRTKILAKSIPKINTNSCYLKEKDQNQSSYKQKYLDLNQKYLQEKERLLQVQNKIMRLKSSVQNYFNNPSESTIQEMVEYLSNGVQSIIISNNNNNNNNNNNRDFKNSSYRHSHNESINRQQRISRVQQSARYMLACFEDIQQFKHQLQFLLKVTSTSSLQQLKSLLSYKFSSNKPMPQSIDQFTYRFLQLQASNNRLKEEYEKMIEDIKQKSQIQLYELKRQQTKQKQKLRHKLKQLQNELKQLQNELFQKDKLYERLLLQLNKTTKKYTEQLKDINSNQLNYINSNQMKKFEQKFNKKFNKVQNNNDSVIEERNFVEKIKKLSQFKLEDNQNKNNNNNDVDISKQGEQDSLQKNESQYRVDFTPQYNIKQQSLNQNQQLSNMMNIPSQSIRNSNNNNNVFISNRQDKNKQLPRQVLQLNQILSQLISQLGSIKYQAQQNIIKLRQANEAIFMLDHKMQQIKYQLQQQVKDQLTKVEHKQSIIYKLQLEKQLQTKQLQYKHQQLNKITTKLSQLSTQNTALKNQLQQLKRQLFNNNKKTIQLFQHNLNLDQHKTQILQFIQSQLQMFIKKISRIDYNKSQLNPHHLQQKQNNSQILINNNNTNKLFPTLPSLPSILNNFFTSTTTIIQKKLSKSQQHHKLYIQKQKQSFQYVQKIKTYQKSILQLQTTLNDTILQKEQYQFLLTELRQQFQTYKKQKTQQIQHMQKKKDHQLINANRVILQQNAKLNQQLIDCKQQNIRINKLLQQKVNQRTFYRRKATQVQTSIQQRDSKILQLQKQCNKYRVYMQQIQRSFQDLVQNQSISSQKITSLQNEKTHLKQQYQRLQQVNKLLESQNVRLRQQTNIRKMQTQKSRRRMQQLIQARQGYEKVNIQLRMKTLQQQQTCDMLQQQIKRLQYDIQKQRKTVDRLQRESNQDMRKQNQFIQRLSRVDEIERQWMQKVNQQKHKYNKLWLALQEKERIINNLMKQIEKFQTLVDKIQDNEQNNNNDKVDQQMIRLQQMMKDKFNIKQNQLQRKQQQLKQLQQRVSQKQTILNIREKQINSKLQQKQKHYDQRQRQMSKKQQELTQIQTQINQLYTQIKQQKQKLQRQKVKLLQQRQSLHQQRQTVNKQKQNLLNQRQQLKISIKSQSQQLQNLQSELKHRQQSVTNKQKQLQDKNVQIQQINRESQLLRQQLNNKFKIINQKLLEIQELKKQRINKQQRNTSSIEQYQQVQNNQIKEDFINEQQKSGQINQNISLNQQHNHQSTSLNKPQNNKLEQSDNHIQVIQNEQQDKDQTQNEDNQNNNNQSYSNHSHQLLDYLLLSSQKRNRTKINNNQNDNSNDNSNNDNDKDIQQQSYTQKNIMSPSYAQCISEQMKINDMALLYSQKKLPLLHSHRINTKIQQQWIQQINLILTSLINQHQYYYNHQPSSKINQLPYYEDIKLNYNKILGKLLRQPTPLQLDLSQIQCKNSISSSSSVNGNRLFGIRYNSSQNQVPQDKQQTYKQSPLQTIPRSNTAGVQLQNDISIMTYKLKVDHLSQLKTMLYQKIQEIQKENIQLKNKLTQTQQSTHLQDKITQLQSKLYTYEDFANDQLKVGVLWNLFKQIIAAYNQDDLQKFERVCRILFKMLNYPQKEIEQFDIQWENRKKKNKISSFFTKWIRDGSVEKRQQSAVKKMSPKKK